MKKIITTLVIIFMCGVFCCYSQDFQVYTSKGNITVKNGDKNELVVPGMILKSTSVITIPSEARLVVLYETNKELYTVKNPTTDQLGNLIKKDGNTMQQLTESYLAFIKQKITDSGNPKDKNYKQSAGTSYRDADSLLLKALVQDEKTDTTASGLNSQKEDFRGM